LLKILHSLILNLARINLMIELIKRGLSLITLAHDNFINFQAFVNSFNFVVMGWPFLGTVI
jgi:hypothetical protein